jgi:hypothetical protein
MNELKSKKTGRTEIVSDEELAGMSNIINRFTVTKLTFKPLIPALEKKIIPELKKKK